MQASQEIFIQSRAGSIEASSLNDIKLRSISGSVSFLKIFSHNLYGLIRRINFYSFFKTSLFQCSKESILLKLLTYKSDNIIHVSKIFETI